MPPKRDAVCEWSKEVQHSNQHIYYNLWSNYLAAAGADFTTVLDDVVRGQLKRVEAQGVVGTGSDVAVGRDIHGWLHIRR